ncbi:protein-methionine-sulfoxide reductase heme-binding subunit MsrQ [Colwellia sp. 1_MG-2023]|uniref:protein-methionine-sulfoxide reductase heme-binding subunit MsrQ n=1 Tax=unclassified Colwellia TaxID=196834 RepID=UPI001C09E996|nr:MULTISPECIES: protein-methionine-sulfoxide reductase heme-binding subunit MsrQ [unclassified Colwellia]MBU2923318.1 protein-methionine-sulfoxide reductase heme-binding subunit MsrQ [Colwellia sp. C2M11]MDO6653695.1 protein-methionine-sulfoxide reductase heme-binding subunit MsrQ [Colwellia sp. 3_MG-2023]MDO6666506.1 protein-methionine-sulfoxide reductase heme-binding subunit MsrQ [Colwellia sp. 2_MG-2023]MDO6690859.1 protein-methionine-sulfoxide reductase heme-binding subunit MsrQ [Colwellia
MKNDTKVLLLKVLIHLGALIPLVNLYFLAFNDKLGADPVESVIHFTGIGAFNLLLITLSVSPIAKLTKQGYLLNVRRLLGLYAYTYALFHLVNFLSFEIQFDGALFISEVWKRPYITIGMAAFFLLTALSITSINKLKRKMGKSWQQLHNVSYIIILLVAIHFYWSVKSELTSPLFYFAMAIMLLLFRYKKIKRLLLSTFN